MRYRDAVHVDLGSFYAREPQFGKMYRILGYFGIVIAAWYASDPEVLGKLFLALVVAWLMAWFRIVGALWRSSIVAACVLCAFLLTVAKVHALASGPVPGVSP